MEYDRALYRVYEKTVEDLLYSRRTIANANANGNGNGNGNVSNSNIRTPRHSPRRRNANVNAAENNNNNNSDDANDISSILSASSFNYEQPTTQSNDPHGTNNGDHMSSNSSNNGNTSSNSNSNSNYIDNIPFLLPHCLTPCPNTLSGAIINGNWRMMFYFIRYKLVHRSNRNCRDRDRDRDYDRDRDHGHDNEEHESVGLPLTPSSLHGRNTTLEMMELTITESSSNLSVASPSSSSSGLRRRPNSPRHTITGGSTGGNGIAALTSDEETGGADYASEDSNSNASINNMNIAPLSPPREGSRLTAATQLAQTVALSQQERNSNSNNNNNNSNSNNSDNDDNNNDYDGSQHSELCSQNSLIILMRMAMFFAFLHIFILYALHQTYVGPRVSKLIPVQLIGKGNRNSSTKAKNIKMTCLERALSTREPEERSQFYQIYGDLDRKSFIEGSSMGTSFGLTREKPLLGRDEVLQVKIIYGDNRKCNGSNSSSSNSARSGEINVGGCSRVRNVNVEKQRQARRATMKELIDKIYRADDEFETSYSNPNEDDPYGDQYYASARYWETPHYRFAIDEAFLFHSDEMLNWMNVSFVNVTLSETCLSTGSDVGGKHTLLSRIAQFLSIIYSTDTIMMNQFMYGIKSVDGMYRNGHVQNMRSLERFSYSAFVLDLEQEFNDNLVLRVVNKVGIFLISFLCFCFISSVTALIVRVLTSSGVMVLFPFFQLARWLGIHVDDRVLDHAHPWLGFARRRILGRGLHSISHFSYAHLGRLILLYAMYEACQATWSTIFYSKSVPVDLPLWIFASSLVWEYFSLIYCRSALSAYFYPRYTVLLFVGYHIYFYTVPFGFFRLALVPYFLLMVHNIIFTLLALEVPATSKGAISIECPREVYSQLSWSEWSANLPSEWTLFLPLNARYIPLHDRNHDDDNVDGAAINRDSSDSTEIV